MTSPNTLLRKILSSSYEVSVDGSVQLVNEVNQKRQQEINKVVAANKPAPPLKLASNATPAKPFSTSWRIRAIDFLRKVGEVTTPSILNLYQLSASWATRRYIWAFDPTISALCLSQDARNIDPHQKTLLSDQFGMGVAALVMEEYFGLSSYVDVLLALGATSQYNNIQLLGSRSPDLLFFDASGSQYFVVECKGSQSARSTSIQQLISGLGQVICLTFPVSSNIKTQSLVIGTFLDQSRTIVHVIDPAPEDEHDLSEEQMENDHRPLTGYHEQQIYVVEDLELFHSRAQRGALVHALRWAGEHEAANQMILGLEISESTPRARISEFPGERVVVEINNRRYHGTRISLLPEFGSNTPFLFRGVDHALLDAANRHPNRLPVEQFAEMEELSAANQPYNVSIGRNGLCLAIGGLGELEFPLEIVNDHL